MILCEGKDVIKGKRQHQCRSFRPFCQQALRVVCCAGTSLANMSWWEGKEVGPELDSSLEENQAGTGEVLPLDSVWSKRWFSKLSSWTRGFTCDLVWMQTHGSFLDLWNQNSGGRAQKTGKSCPGESYVHESLRNTEVKEEIPLGKLWIYSMSQN